MPFVHIRVAGARLLPAQVVALQTEATHLMATIMRKKAELTAVLVEQLDVDGWSVGAARVPLAAHLDVKVTSGTNTPDEKAAFVAKAHGLLKTVCGANLPVATYVVVDEIAANAWGYDGQTQAARHY